MSNYSIIIPSRSIMHRLSGRVSSAALAAAIIFAATPGWAEDATNQGSVAARGDIVVTAQRREESVSKVPISIQTFSQEKMDIQGIRQIGDISRLTPALYFNNAVGSANTNRSSNISIRGVASDVGSATTAIYIDDTPIQMRNISYLGGNPYPRVFDLERVEVLRGPQGTLFGAGAEGGAVRFISTQPTLDAMHVYGRSEISSTDEGGLNYEAGLAVGAPLGNTLAFRVSGWYRRDGGYIDQVTPQTNNVVAKDVNSQNTYALKAALLWKPNDSITVTPSVFYQKVSVNALDVYWHGYGTEASNDYKTGVNNLEPGSDRFVIPAVKVQVDLGNVGIVLNSSYFNRDQRQIYSYTTYQSYLRTGNPFGVFSNKDPSNSNANMHYTQKNFTEEARVYSFDNKLIDWTAGVFYSNTKQGYQNLTESGRIPGVLAGGLTQYLGRYSFYENTDAKDEQFAVYGNVDIKPIDKLKISVSARFTRNSSNLYDLTDGPTVGNVRSEEWSSSKQNSFTPKLTATYQVTPSNMLYGTASKGFRPGGAQLRVSPDYCATDLKALGLTQSPRSYDSDSLWNYELGTKNRFFGGRLQVDASIYHIKWSNIQQSISLPSCNLTFIGNLGKATGNGGELALSVSPVSGLEVGGNLAYTKLSFDDNIYSGNGLLLRADGQRIGGPKWTGAIFGEYQHDIFDDTKAYLRVDYSFARRFARDTAEGTFSYDPDMSALSGTDYMSLRIGARFKEIELSLFADNLTNSRDILTNNHDGLGGSLWYRQSYRPRTIGMTGQIRY